MLIVRPERPESIHLIIYHMRTLQLTNTNDLITVKAIY